MYASAYTHTRIVIWMHAYESEICIFVCIYFYIYIHVYIYVFSSTHIKILTKVPRVHDHPPTKVSGLFLLMRGPVLTPTGKLHCLVTWQEDSCTYFIFKRIQITNRFTMGGCTTITHHIAPPLSTDHTLHEANLYIRENTHQKYMHTHLYEFTHPQNATQRILPHPIEPPQLLPWSLYPKYPLRTSETTSTHARLTNMCICIHVLRVYIWTCIPPRYINTYVLYTSLYICIYIPWIPLYTYV